MGCSTATTALNFSLRRWFDCGARRNECSGADAVDSGTPGQQCCRVAGGQEWVAAVAVGRAAFALLKERQWSPPFDGCDGV